jgi:hypothetical protein
MSGSAFPQIETTFYEDGEELKHPRISSFGGMELRDWFAGQALLGVLAKHQDITSNPPDSSFSSALMTADFAYKIADAMMARRLTDKG